MPKTPQVDCELIVNVAGVEVYRQSVKLNSPPGMGDLPQLNLEAMVKGGALQQLPLLTIKSQSIDALRTRLREAGKAYLEELKAEQEATEAEHRAAQEEAE